MASDLHSCFLFPSSLLEGWGGNQHFKGKTFPGLAWKDARSWFFPPVWLTPEVVIIFDKKKWSLLKKTTFHLLSRLLMKLLVWGGWGGWQPKKPGPLQKNGRATSAGQGQAGGLLLARPTLILAFCPPPLCTPLLWQGRRGARASTERGGTEKDCQFNSRKPTVCGRIRRALGLGLCVWGWEETWRLKARAS